MDKSEKFLIILCTEKTIIIQCKNYPEVKRIIKHTGKIILEGDCKIITNNAIIKSATDFQTKLIEAYLPKVNITLLRNVSNGKQYRRSKIKKD